MSDDLLTEKDYEKKFKAETGMSLFRFLDAVKNITGIFIHIDQWRNAQFNTVDGHESHSMYMNWVATDEAYLWILKAQIEWDLKSEEEKELCRAIGAWQPKALKGCNKGVLFFSEMKPFTTERQYMRPNWRYLAYYRINRGKIIKAAAKCGIGRKSRPHVQANTAMITALFERGNVDWDPIHEAYQEAWSEAVTQESRRKQAKIQSLADEWKILFGDKPQLPQNGKDWRSRFDAEYGLEVFRWEPTGQTDLHQFQSLETYQEWLASFEN